MTEDHKRTEDHKPLRIGIPAREAAERWERSAEWILADEGQPDVDIQKANDHEWRWEVPDVESGHIEFRDAGEEHGEFVLDLSRTDAAAQDRIRTIVNRFTEAASGKGIDRPVVAVDPAQGEPPEAATEEDQPL